ncbi:MAG: hypothetical protein IJ011_04715 [Clostridia bacterium]|nr:hypothetical protein [Clostridia bacterium]
MLKKLKLKFILINMVLVGLIMSIVFGAVLYLTCRSEATEIAEELDGAIQLHMRFPQINFGADIGGDIIPDRYNEEEMSRQLPLEIVTVSVSETGDIIDVREYGISIDDEVLQRAVRKAEQTSDPHSVSLVLNNEEKLIYMQREIMGHRFIAFTSSELLLGKIRNASLIYSVCLMLSLVLFLFVSYLLSNFAIRPVERAWMQQKQFVADASHDLKTPLTVILANSDILRAHRGETVESQLQWVDSTAEEAGHMRGLCEQLLELASSEDAQKHFELCEVDLSDMCEQIDLQFEPLAFEKNVEIETKISSDVVLRTDRSVCARVIHILLDNAIKYSRGGEKVSFSLEKTRQGAVMSFRNFGDVIPKEELPHIFERFYRADKARAVGGHGLGLAIAKNLVDQVGGRITVSSSAEAGTLFTVYLKNI